MSINCFVFSLDSSLSELLVLKAMNLSAEVGLNVILNNFHPLSQEWLHHLIWHCRIAGSTFYLCHISERGYSNGSTPSVCPSVTLLRCLVCEICNSKSSHFFIFKLCTLIVHILKMCTFYFVHISQTYLILIQC